MKTASDRSGAAFLWIFKVTVEDAARRTNGRFDGLHRSIVGNIWVSAQGRLSHSNRSLCFVQIAGNGSSTRANVTSFDPCFSSRIA